MKLRLNLLLRSSGTRTTTTRPITLFTAQWADLTLEELAAKAAGWGYDGLELACHPNHFDVRRALADRSYAGSVRAVLDAHGLICGAIGAQGFGQAVSDTIDARHRVLLPAEVWGDGDVGGVQARAVALMMDVARAAAALGVTHVNGFTGSPIWAKLYGFPFNDYEEIDRAYELVAEQWTPILDVFDQEGVRFALEVHPTEIAYDFVTTERILAAFGRRATFGLNLDPSHLVHQFLDPARFAEEFADRIYHVHVKDTKIRLDGRRSILCSHLDFGDPRRGWDFVSAGRGDVDFEALFGSLQRIGYAGPLSVEWEDAEVDREGGAKNALAFVRRMAVAPSASTSGKAAEAPCA